MSQLTSQWRLYKEVRPTRHRQYIASYPASLLAARDEQAMPNMCFYWSTMPASQMFKVSANARSIGKYSTLTSLTPSAPLELSSRCSASRPNQLASESSSCQAAWALSSIPTSHLLGRTISWRSCTQPIAVRSRCRIW